ncbi:MAG: nickel pincer cofactor biosynthesis protein LarC [Lentisphaeria bacterium]|nr:nickel pincer cofactor biosynthesis protein LarC [Lentisphaeria bacterium]
MSKTILYLECATGISGDMTVAALLDLGASKIKLLAALDSLNVEGYSVTVRRANSHGVDACSFDVELEHEHEHEHELGHHEHEHGHHHGHDHAALEHEHAHEAHEHGHEHHHEHEHGHHHPHVHRNLADVTAILNSGDLTPHARELALKIFGIVAEAESKAHGKPVEEVHFHEVGAIDSIVDIAAAAVCLDDLGIDDVVVTGLSEGTGFVECQHGLLPVPVPAVANIAAASGLPLRILPVQGEMVTPTGAAIAAAVRTRSALPESFTIKKIGLGAGKREFGMPNVLRAMLIEETAAADAPPAEIMILETNIDDSTGETLGLAMDSLLAAGALDVHYVPVFMKKNRPAWLLRVICREADVPAMERVIFTETSSIGLRKLPAGRTCLARTVVDVTLAAGSAKVKKCSFDGQTFYYPEYESIKALAAASGVPFADLFRDAAETARANDER